MRSRSPPSFAMTHNFQFMPSLMGLVLDFYWDDMFGAGETTNVLKRNAFEVRLRN